MSRCAGGFVVVYLWWTVQVYSFTNFEYMGYLPLCHHLTIKDNYFLTLDLSKPFNISSPPITGLNTSPLPPLGPPAISLGALWSSSDGSYLYQFAGECSDTPATTPAIELLWKYDIRNQSWASVAPQGDTIQRPAEGASCVIPAGNGVGVYVGGHLDAFTVPGWSIETPRAYLQSMITFDMVNPFHHLSFAGDRVLIVLDIRSLYILLFVKFPFSPKGRWRSNLRPQSRHRQRRNSSIHRRRNKYLHAPPLDSRHLRSRHPNMVQKTDFWHPSSVPRKPLRSPSFR